MKRIALVLVLIAAAMVFVPHTPAGAATCQPALKGLTLSPASVPGGAPATAKVTLSCKAPAAVKVGLAGFTGAAAPRSVRVARGKTTGTAAITTSVTRVARHGHIKATLRKVVRTAALAITRTPRTCKNPALSSLSVATLVYVGQRPQLTLRLNCAAAAPVRVSLTSSNSLLPVPATVTIGRYYQTAAVSLDPKAYEIGQYSASVTARLGTRSKAKTITVDPGLASVTIPACSEPNCVSLDVLFTGNIPAGGYTVQLASNNAAITVPSSYSFQAGSIGGVFPVTVNPVTANTTVTLSATFEGRTLTASTVLLPPWNPSDSLTVTAEQAAPDYGQEFDLEYQALLSNPAPASGETVTFSSPSASLELQTTTDFIGAGDDDAYVDVNTANVTSPVHTTLVATLDGVSASLPVTIEPGLASFTNVPATVAGGQPFTATINLAGPVDTATTVSLQSTAGILNVPGTVTIPAGQSSASFQATTVAVTADSTVNIYAYLGSTSLPSAAITVTP
ncbi:MAG TPA: hypothetical protein VGG83_26520 [Trebonia sp.]|jgi:hypothetical protein